MSLLQHKQHKIQNVNDLHDEQLSFGDRVADAIANAIGSWAFIIIQAIILALWFWLNTVAWFYHWDGYPFILCNLFMSAEAAFSAPVIMMSQNRQSAKDRLTAEEDYKINRKGEQEIEQMIEHLCKQDEQIIQANQELLKQTNMLVQLLQNKQS